MKTTGNLGLRKPDGTDIVDIADLNNNMDVLDTEVVKLASTTAPGRMSAADKAKLDGIAAGANNYVHPAGDGSLHVPATGTGNSGKVLKAGSTAGSAAWGNVAFAEVNGKPTTLGGYGITDAAPSSHVGAGGSAHAAATTSAAGFMSTADKAKLDGIAAGANNYTHPAAHPASIITQDANNRFVTDAEKSAWNAKASTAVATTSTNGLMAAADKTKLNGIAAGAQVNTVTSVAGKTGAVSLAKADVGLGSVENLPVATQAQAEAGTANTVYMTPLRTKQYVDQKIQNNVSFRVNSGELEYYNGTGWSSVGFNWMTTTPQIAQVQPATGAVNTTLVDVTGSGVLTGLSATVFTGVGNGRFTVEVDGVKFLNFIPTGTGLTLPQATKFNTSLKITVSRDSNAYITFIAAYALL